MVLCAIYIDYNYDNDEIDYNEIRRLHKENLDKSPFKNTKQLSKSERKDLQLPPNPYNERLWELTMDPVLGRPRSENIYQIQDELYQKSINEIPGVPGENPDMAWIPRGPTNIAGRTNGIMFDPNDATNKKVFAGGVSGGTFVSKNLPDPLQPGGAYTRPAWTAGSERKFVDGVSKGSLNNQQYPFYNSYEEYVQDAKAAAILIIPITVATKTSAKVKPEFFNFI